MIHEFGFNSTISSETNLKVTADLLDVLKEYEIPWCAWCDNFGPVMDSKWAASVGLMWDNSNGLYGEENVYRKGSTYETYVDRYVVDKELLKIYKKYMK